MSHINPIQDGLLWGCSPMEGGGTKMPTIPKNCHTYLTMMKLGTVIPYPKKLASAYFHRKLANFAISRNTDIDCILIHKNFDDVSKNGYPSFLK